MRGVSLGFGLDGRVGCCSGRRSFAAAISVAPVSVVALADGANSGLAAQARAEDQTQQQTFGYSGSSQTFTVPAGVTSLTIEAYGAAGGAAPTGYWPVPGGLGGYA